MKKRLVRIGSAVGAVLLAFSQDGYGVTITANAWQYSDVVGGASCSIPTSGVVMVRNASSPVPLTGPGATIIPVSDASNVFTGNYATARIGSLAFTVRSSGRQLGETTRVLLRSGTRLWSRYNISASTQSGVPLVNQVALDLSDGWSTTATTDPDKMSAMWDADMQKVGSVGVEVVMQSGTAAQSFTFSDFGIIGDRVPGSLTPLEQALADRFYGATSPDEVDAVYAAEDSDGDGMTDLEEILAEFSAYDTRRTYETQLFRINAQADEAGMKITWACVKGKRYTILRTTDLNLPPDQWDAFEQPAAAETG